MSKKKTKKQERLFILLAEDSADMASFMIEILEEDEGCKVEWVKNGHEAFAKIDNFTYDLIITDFEMGKFMPDGLEVVGYAQGSDRNSETPSVVWSGLDRTYDAARRGIAVDYFLTKDRLDMVGEVIANVRESRED